MYTPGLEPFTDRKAGYRAYSPGLEKAEVREADYAQGLEPYASSQDKLPAQRLHSHWPGSASASYTSQEFSGKRFQGPGVQGLRKSRFCLFSVLGVVVLVTIIAATIAGVIAAQKRGTNDNNPRSTATPVAPSSSSLSPTIATATASPTSTSAVLRPSSDCSKIGATYSLRTNTARAINSDVRFEINCNRDLKLPLVMGLRVFTFEDCINACASHSTNAQNASMGCIAAVYKPDSGQPLTCWLKSTGDDNAETASVGVDVALISQG